MYLSNFELIMSTRHSLNIIGELYHGQRRSGPNEIKFTIRVYPFSDYRRRTPERCSQIVNDLLNHSRRDGNGILNNKNKNNKSREGKKKAKKNSVSYGHLGKILIK